MIRALILAGALALQAVPAAAQAPSLDELFGSGGGGLPNLPGLGTGNPGSVLGDLLGQGGPPLPSFETLELEHARSAISEFFGDPTLPPVLLDDPALAQRLALAAACDDWTVAPMLDGLLPDLANMSSYEVDPGMLPQLEMMLSLMEAAIGNDACGVALVLLLKAGIEAFDGRYNQAILIYENVLPPLGRDEPALLLTARLALAGLMGIQSREEEALALLEEVAPAVDRTFGPDSQISILRQGVVADIRTELGNAARADGRAGEALEHYEAARAIYQEVEARLERGAPLNRQLLCLARQATAQADVATGRLADARAALEDILRPDGACFEVMEKLPYWSSRARLWLGRIHLAEGRLAEAGPELEEAVRSARRTRGSKEPTTLEATRSLAELRFLQGDVDAALAAAGQLEDGLLGWLDGEVRQAASQGQRSRLVAQQGSHQELALLIALAAPDHAGAQEAAAESVLRYKGLQGEEDATLERLIRSGSGETRELAARIASLRVNLATAVASAQRSMAPASAPIDALAQQLSAAEIALARLSGLFKERLSVRDASLARVQERLRALDGPAVLVEFRQVRMRPLGALPSGRETDHMVAVVIEPEAVRAVDVGPAYDVSTAMGLLLDPGFMSWARADPQGREAALVREAQGALYRQLIEPLGIADKRTVVLAPDGVITLAPFLALRRADGTMWVEEAGQTVSVVHSGRALLAVRDAPGRGLVAVGGVEFGVGVGPLGTFVPLPGTMEELATVKRLFEEALGETAVALTGDAASDVVLREALTEPPRVLHLATHGFFLTSGDRAERPLLLSGVALSGANRGEAADGSGLLLAIEAQGLNLEGTELAVVSACRSGLGVVERGEGVHGLARAFRVAGVGASVVAIRPVGDRDAQLFTERFYATWLSGRNVSLAGAFRDAAASLAGSSPAVDWTAFILVENVI